MSTENTYVNPSYEQFFKANLLEQTRFDLIVPNSEKQKIIDRFSEQLSSFREEIAHHPNLDFKSTQHIYKKIFEAYNEFCDEILPQGKEFKNSSLINCGAHGIVDSAYYDMRKIRSVANFSHEDTFIASEISRFFFSNNLNTENKTYKSIQQSYQDKVHSNFFQESQNSQYSKKINVTNEDLLKAFPTLSEQDGYKDTFLPEVQEICEKNNICGFVNKQKPTTHDEAIKILNNFSLQARRSASYLGISQDCITFNGALSISTNHSDSSEASFGHYSFSLQVRENMSHTTLVHEWTHALDNYIYLKLKNDMNNAGFASTLYQDDPFISSLDVIVPSETLFNSPNAQAARELKDMIREFTFDPSEQISKERQQLCKDICSDYWKVAMGDKYFALPKEIKEEFESVKTLLAIKDVTFNAKTVDGQIIPNELPNPVLNGLLEKHNISCEGDKDMLCSIAPQTNFHSYMSKSFAKFDNVLIGQDTAFIKNSRAYSHHNRGEDFNSDEYYTNSAELLARYTESNISPKTSLRNNVLSNVLANKEHLMNGTFRESEIKSAQYFEATKESIRDYHTSMQSIFAKVFGPEKIRAITPQDYFTATIFNEFPNNPGGPQFVKSSQETLKIYENSENRLDNSNKNLIDFILKKGKWENRKDESETIKKEENQSISQKIGKRVIQAFNKIVQTAGNSFMNWLTSDNNQTTNLKYEGFSSKSGNRITESSAVPVKSVIPARNADLTSSVIPVRNAAPTSSAIPARNADLTSSVIPARPTPTLAINPDIKSCREHLFEKKPESSLNEPLTIKVKPK